ncbi:hypothetical protein [Bradyrhizobium sp. NAS96.2]|uniref:hypothetical protein n=1 Tax=Bradyrhizobium sp. NAS96.2 TaxID=1680160 RepID=UPI00093CF23B|nr:hypothetical protein [Bradyrhizobium sp. NAS96.2]OKO75208.1 hypothetical protein AC628_20620 [Bradyrhizobium sp. NAS96.2]
MVFFDDKIILAKRNRLRKPIFLVNSRPGWIKSTRECRHGGGHVDRIFNGAKSDGLPIEQPVKFVLAINLETAKTLRIVVPKNLLARADEVIE